MVGQGVTNNKCERETDPTRCHFLQSIEGTETRVVATLHPPPPLTHYPFTNGFTGSEVSESQKPQEAKGNGNSATALIKIVLN